MRADTALPVLRREDCLRLVSALIEDELRALRKMPAALEPRVLYSDSTAITAGGSEGFNADSLELLALAGRTNHFFCLHEAGTEDNLLRRRTLGAWVDIVLESLGSGKRSIAFSTSGSMGTPKICLHSLETLWQEVERLAVITRPVSRIIACAQPYHIYGFLFTVLLPSFLGVPVVNAWGMSPASLSSLLRQGDLLVSFPSYWEFFNTSLPSFPQGVSAVTSTAPCPPALRRALLDKGVARVVEVYGSSETAGIGARISEREREAEYYQLFPYWKLKSLADGRSIVTRTLPNGEIGEPIPLMDEVEFESEEFRLAGESFGFRPVRRLDEAVQVGGVNVFPARIAERLRAIEGIRDAAVRLMRPDEGDRLKAFLVLEEGWSDTPQTRQYVHRQIDALFTVSERPKFIVFGTHIPRAATGKQTDWNIGA